MPITEDQVLRALKTVQDPELFKDLVTLNMVKGIKIFEGHIAVKIELTNPASPVRDRLRADITNAITTMVPGAAEVDIDFSAQVRTANAAKTLLPGVKNIIAVGAGKGGVGKSTIAVNLAAGLALQGAKVGLLDADVYGPSIPTMTGLEPRMPELINGNRFKPFLVGPESNPIKVMSIGFIVEKEKALIWRGPMAQGAVKQFVSDVEWGDLDYLVVDLPPGTGDISLTLAQIVPLTGAVIVATPQEVALADARRAVRMFQTLGVEILGVVENMSYFVCEHGKEYDIFGRGGAQLMAQQMGLPFLGEVPIDMSIRINSDQGTPLANFLNKPDSYLMKVTQTLAGRVTMRNLTRPTASIKLEVT